MAEHESCTEERSSRGEVYQIYESRKIKQKSKNKRRRTKATCTKRHDDGTNETAMEQIKTVRKGTVQGKFFQICLRK